MTKPFISKLWNFWHASLNTCSFEGFFFFFFFFFFVGFFFFFFFFSERNSNYFLYNFFHKEGQGSDNLDVICKDKGYYLRRATYPKNCFCLGKTLLRYQATNSFYHLCDNRFCLAFTVWTHTNSTGCFKKRLHHCFIN